MSELIEHTPKLWERKLTDHSLWMIYCPGSASLKFDNSRPRVANQRRRR